jgi:hypothetical protein
MYVPYKGTSKYEFLKTVPKSVIPFNEYLETRGAWTLCYPL